MKSIWFTKKRIVLISMGLVVLVGVALFSGFRGSSICTVCGANQNEIDWQLPLTQFTFWKHTSVASTRLSKAAERAGLCPPHQHQFLFASGSGNGIMCSIGQGRFLYTATYSEPLATFIADIANFRGKAVAAQWLAESLDPKRSMGMLVIVQSYPEGGCRVQKDFDDWWQNNLFEITGRGPDANEPMPEP